MSSVPSAHEPHSPTSEVMRATSCQSCGAPIKWVVTEAGRNMPIDAEPSEKGNLLLIDRYVRFVKTREREDRDVPLYISHFATCPDARAWKRSR